MALWRSGRLHARFEEAALEDPEVLPPAGRGRGAAPRGRGRGAGGRVPVPPAADAPGVGRGRGRGRGRAGALAPQARGRGRGDAMDPGVEPTGAAAPGEELPAAPNLAEVMARQTLLLERIVEQSQQQPRCRALVSDAAPYHQSAGSRMAMFLSMRPPSFDRAVDPLDADE